MGDGDGAAVSRHRAGEKDACSVTANLSRGGVGDIWTRVSHPLSNQLDQIKHHSATATSVSRPASSQCYLARISFHAPVRYRDMLVELHARRIAGGEARRAEAGEGADRLATSVKRASALSRAYKQAARRRARNDAE
jgi:hypothetical protein